MSPLPEPLTWDKLSRPSRLALPTYIGLFLWVGQSYIRNDTTNLGPTLAYANTLWIDLQGWGVMFLVTGLIMLLAVLTKERTMFRYALWIGIISLLTWAVVLFFASINNNASSASWAWPLALAILCRASEISLLRGDR